MTEQKQNPEGQDIGAVLDAIQVMLTAPDFHQALRLIIQQTGLSSRETFVYPVPVLPDNLPELTDSDAHRLWHNVQASGGRLYDDIRVFQEYYNAFLVWVELMN